MPGWGTLASYNVQANATQGRRDVSSFVFCIPTQSGAPMQVAHLRKLAYLRKFLYPRKVAYLPKVANLWKCGGNLTLPREFKVYNDLWQEWFSLRRWPATGDHNEDEDDAGEISDLAQIDCTC